MGEDVFEEIDHGIKEVAEDVGHVVVESVEFPAKATKVIDTAVKDIPAFKAELTTLITDAKTVFVDGMDAVSAKGLNWTEDTAVIASIVAFAVYFKTTFIPALEAAYTEVNADVT